MPSLNHLHTYQRSTNKSVFRCVDPYCTHFTAKSFLVGKAAICPLCKQEFILSNLQLRNKLPRCKNCSTSKKAQEAVSLETALAEIFEEVKI